MADTKITALAAISTIDAAVDPLAIVDVSDTSMAASGTTKKVTAQQILGSGGNASVGTLNASGAATLSSTLAVTGTSTFTGAMTANGNLTANANTTLGNAQTDVITINGQLQAREGELASSIRAAASDYAGVAFDGATSGTRITSTLTGQNIGTGDFSLWSRFRVPALAGFASNPAIIALGPSSTDASGNSSIRVVLLAAGSLSVRINDAAGVTTSGDIANFATNFAGQVVDVVVTRTGSTLKVYVNGTDTAYTGTPAASESINSVYCLVGIGGSVTAIFSGSIYRSAVFNRALSEADVVDLIENGVNPADQWGSQTAAYSSDFSAGTNNWTGTRSTVAGNVDGVLGVNDTLKVVIDGTASNSHYALNATVPGMVASKRYKVAFDYYIPSANSLLNGVRLYQLTRNSPITANQTTTGAWATTSPVEFVAFGTRLDLLGTAAGNNNFNGNSTDEFYLKNMVLTRIGAIVDLDFTTGIGTTAYDSSSNNLDGILNGGVDWTVPKTHPSVFPAGTVAAPSISFSGDPDTGIWNSAANQLTIATGGSSRVSVNNNQVLINAVGSAALPSFVNASNSSTGLFWPTTSTLAISTGGTERLRIKSTGQLRFVPLASDPGSAESGDVYYNSTTNKLRCYNGTTWNDLF